MKGNKFILIDTKAVEDIVSTRMLQSDDFPLGKLFSSVLCGEAEVSNLTALTHISYLNQGMYILHEGDDHKDILVIDLEAAPIFSECTSKDILLRFQKLLRFATRRWSHFGPSHNEKLVSGNKGIVFPYPINTQSLIRITVDLAPDKERRKKRTNGNEMLAFRIGVDDGGGATEVAPVANFRRATEGLQDAVLQLKRAVEARDAADKKEKPIGSLIVTKLASDAIKGRVRDLSFNDWLPLLTNTQRKFVEEALSSPQRIEGPAGTGKTLCLVLKCIVQIKRAAESGRAFRALFIAHSEATKKTIEQMFAAEGLSSNEDLELFALHTLRITTLHELCRDLLRYEISDTELIDRDAYESKQSQYLYAVEALEECLRKDLPSHRMYMTEGFCRFLEANDVWSVAQMLQHEISVVVKGRADHDLERYKRVPRLTYGFPVENEGDKIFTFLLFQAYQRRLHDSGQYDTDDVVLSASRQLGSPIWRRRREKEGYDSIFIDETHLFNINELSIFHNLTKENGLFPIAYSADISQSLGDRGWNDLELSGAIVGADGGSNVTTNKTKFTSIFRCSPDIVDLAFSVTSSGATLFTNFDDPMAASSSVFTEKEERKCQKPKYHFFATDDVMIAQAFSMAEKFANEMHATRADVAIIVFGEQLFGAVERFARTAHKPVELVKHRGDTELVRRAKSSGRFVLSTPDFVGGLEFEAVILVGVDKGRVPPALDSVALDSENFVSYATHQRLYVAITRARYRVAILGLKARGASDIFLNAMNSSVLEMCP